MEKQEEKVAPPPGLVHSGEELPKAEKAQKEKSAYQLRRMESSIPDSMGLYEQNIYVQAFLILVTVAVAVANLSVNFTMLKVYIDQENAFNAAKSLTGPLPAEDVTLLGEFQNRTAQGEILCDVSYFASQSFDLTALESTVRYSTQFAYASCYLAAILMVPAHLIFKIASAYFLITREFSSGSREKTDAAGDTTTSMLQSMGQKKEEGVQGMIKPKPVAMTRAHKHSLILENEDERSVRIFLRGESILFAWVQGFQDIPQGTLATLFIILQRSIRGAFCFGTYKDVQLSPQQNFDEINSTAYLMLGLIALSTIWNFLMLGSRWFRYFHYRTEKYAKKPRSLNCRLAVAAIWTVIYLLAVATPIFALTYTGLGRDLIGYGDDAIGVFFVLTLIGAVCAAFGFFLIFCWWGTNFAEGICVGCVVWEAFCVAMNACECEICEFCDFGCCC